jgi:hypothetical protein
MSLHLAILHAARLLVPSEHRSEWFAEWQSELCYVRRSAEGKAIAFCLGAFPDALWLRRNALPSPAQTSCVASPYLCVVFLAVLAAIAVFFPFRLPDAPPRPPTLPLALSLAALTPCAILCVCAIRRGFELLEEALDRPGMVILDLRHFSSARLEEYPANRHAQRGVVRLGPWVFLAVKSVLLGLICAFGTIDLGGVVLFFYVVAFRWAIADQRERCPVCLRRLTNPTRIGEPSHTFLEWYGTELMCAKGHGLLHVPEIRSSSYSADRWLALDPSWSSLFSAELSARSSV